MPSFEKIRINVPAEDLVFTRAIMDTDGYIWMASGNGLFRFDGIQFKSFYPESDSAGFHVTALFEDDDRIIWIGCKDGRIFKLENGKIILFDPKEGTANQPITDILVTVDRILWWSTAGEGIYFNSGDKVYNINHDDGLPDDYVYDLENDNEGMVWAGTDGGVALCGFRGGEKKISLLDKSMALPDIMVTVIKEDEKGNLWLGFQEGGAGYLIPGRSEFISPAREQMKDTGPVNDITITDGSAWLGTASGKLFEIKENTAEATMNNLLPDNLMPGKIFDLMEDPQGNIWILTSTGLYRSTGNRLRFLNHAAGRPLRNIHSITADEMQPGIIWFSDDQGLFSLDPVNGGIKKYLDRFKEPGLKITCLHQDNYGYIWAGTFNYGVIRLNPGDGSYYRITEDQGLVNNNVLSISRHIDTMWLATLGGASEIVLQSSTSGKTFNIKSFNYETGLVNNFIYSVYEDKDNRIWLATDGDGINVRNREGWITYNDKNGLTDDVIYSITGDKYGNVWAASASKGLFRYNGNRFIHCGIEEGLSSLAVTGITAIADEVLVVHENGLDVIYIPTGNIAHYGEETGLAGIQPDLNVISVDSEGNAWLGTRTGIIRYRPGKPVSYAPRTVLEEMLVYLEPRSMNDNMVLGSKEHHISFRYAGLWYSNPGKVVYQVMLEGYDLGWNNTYDRQVTYSSLSPGDYTFKVRSSLDQSFENAEEESFSFHIRQPVWLRLWFIILIILIISLLIYLFIISREKRLRKKEQAKKEKVEFEFQVLKNQVNPHFLFNSFSTLISLIEDQPEQAVQYTEKLSDFFRTILQYKDQKIIPVQEELALIESYYFLIKKRFGDNLNLEINLDHTLRMTYIPPMTLQILIENAVKHNIISRDKPLFIKVYEDEERIVVENNLQPKLMPEISTGIGLDNIRKRYRLITEKEIELNQSEVKFKIILPVIN